MFTKMTLLAGLGASAGLALATVSAEAQDVQPEGRTCFVEIDRSADPDLFSVVRQEFEDETCTCFVTTGPTTQNASVENQIAALLRSRTCINDPAVAIPSNNPALAAGAGAGGGIGLGVGGAAALAAAAGLVIAFDGDDRPVSP